MRVKPITTVAAAIAFSACSFATLAEEMNNSAGHNWMPQQPTNNYWQTPNWPSFNASQGNAPAPSGYAQQPQMQQPPVQQPPMQRPPMQNNNYRQQNAPNFNRPNPANNYPAPNMNRYAPPPQNAYRGNPYPPQRGPYPGPNMNQYGGPDNGASAYNMPGYQRNRNNSGWNNNKFWGNSGPSRWMNPNKQNMEQGWDDMINAPSRMGEMPGGWTAPEVSMPNPIDMGDQMQDNVKDLPEQIRNMDVGN